MTITRDDPRFWDVRTLERRMRRGQLTKKDYEKHLKTLPDVDEKKSTISVANVADDDEDDFDDIEDEEDDVDDDATTVHAGAPADAAPDEADDDDDEDLDDDDDEAADDEPAGE